MNKEEVELTGQEKGLLQGLKFRAMSSIIQSRAAIASMLGKAFGGARDVYEALGYPGIDQITAQQYYGKYRRQDIAARIVEAEPKESWEKDPFITIPETKDETPFEKQWKELVLKHKIYTVMERADIVSRIGRFGVLLLGFNDGNEFHKEVTRADKLLYIQPYGEWSIEIRKWEEDKRNERFGLPTLYEITITDADNRNKQTLNVHWTRIIHIVEMPLDNNVYGLPVLERVYNRLENLELIVGGSAEMFWQAAFMGLAFLAKDGYDISEDTEEINEKISKFVHKMQRYMVMKGVDIKEIAPAISSPKEHFNVQLDLIAAARAYPKRILLGSERGELASSQDDENWTSRIEHRREKFNGPEIIRPFIDRLIRFGVLQDPGANGYSIEWPSLMSPSDKDRAEIAKMIAEAFKAWMETPGTEFMDPITFFEDVLEWSEDKIERMRSYIEKELEKIKEAAATRPMDENDNQDEGDQNNDNTETQNNN